MLMDDIHAVSMLLAIVFPLVCILCSEKKKPSTKRALVAFLISFSTSLISFLFSLHSCGAGIPATQWIFAAILTLIVICFIKAIKLRLILTSALILLSLIFSQWYVFLVHSPGYTGSPKWIERSELGEDEEFIFEIQKLLKSHSPDHKKILAAGWFETIFESNLGEMSASRMKAKASSTWHSFFSGIYEVHYDPVFLWYPGGRIWEGLEGIELRERPSGPKNSD